MSRLLSDIHTAEPSDKVLIFVQWDSLRDSTVKSINKRLNFSPHILKGSASERKNILQRFSKGVKPEDQVLVLSMEESSSGMNLVCANHVIFVHPFFGEHAISREKQAIGRVRRQGQQKKCFLYRFYTEDTIEQKLVERHSNELQDIPVACAEGDRNNSFFEPPIPIPPDDAHIAKQPSRQQVNFDALRASIPPNVLNLFQHIQQMGQLNNGDGEVFDDMQSDASDSESDVMLNLNNLPF